MENEAILANSSKGIQQNWNNHRSRLHHRPSVVCNFFAVFLPHHFVHCIFVNVLKLTSQKPFLAHTNELFALQDTHLSRNKVCGGLEWLSWFDGDLSWSFEVVVVVLVRSVSCSRWLCEIAVEVQCKCDMVV